MKAYQNSRRPSAARQILTGCSVKTDWQPVEAGWGVCPGCLRAFEEPMLMMHYDDFFIINYTKQTN
ncbi:MAG: hypothetical protein IIZ88_00590 [Prevotella sp.]|nr:hypothetical protein [Prevotella sp.]